MVKKFLIFALVALILAQIANVTVFAADDDPEISGSYVPSNNMFLNACFPGYNGGEYSPDLLVSAEDILRYIFTINKGKSVTPGVYGTVYEQYSGEVKTEMSEKEFTEGTLKVKTTLEKATIPSIADSYVSIERRYIWKDGEYQISAIDIDVEVGEDGVYFIETLEAHRESPGMPLALWEAGGATENPVAGHIEYFIHGDGEAPDESNPTVHERDYYTKTTSFHDTTLEYVVDIDPNTYFTNPEKWKGTMQYYTSIKYDTVGAEHSLTGEAIEEGDYKNYQVVNISRKIKLVYPEVEMPKAPATSLTTAVYAVVGMLAAGVVAWKRRRK